MNENKKQEIGVIFVNQKSRLIILSTYTAAEVTTLSISPYSQASAAER